MFALCGEVSDTVPFLLLRKDPCNGLMGEEQCSISAGLFHMYICKQVCRFVDGDYWLRILDIL